MCLVRRKGNEYGDTSHVWDDESTISRSSSHCPAPTINIIGQSHDVTYHHALNDFILCHDPFL